MINRSPSPFHAVHTCVQRLKESGFEYLSERDHWKLERNHKYFFTRNQSTIVAFAVGGKYQPGNGAQIIAAHTDSPHPKVKPVSKQVSSGFLEVGVELYGGGLWHTWFDRDLALAGRVIVKNEAGESTGQLVQIDRPLLRVPTLAIHLTVDSERTSFAPNKENHMLPILATTIKSELQGNGGTEDNKHHPLLLNLLAAELGCKPSEIGDFELSLYDHNKSVIGGALNEFVYSARLDNLCSSFCALEALIAASTHTSLENDSGIRAICLFDHEECGSQSSHGAASSLLERLLIRLASAFMEPSQSAAELEELTFRNSFVISADMAHALHPNYSDRHEKNHRPAIHKGVVFKYNSNQRYASNAVSVALLRQVAEKHNVPIQEFVVKNDSPCGTTVGPILAANTGVRTVDIGAPQLSMHSIREMCGTDDVFHYYSLMKGFFENFREIDRNLRTD